MFKEKLPSLYKEKVGNGEKVTNDQKTKLPSLYKEKRMIKKKGRG